MTFIKTLRTILPGEALKTNEPLAKYTSFKIGGKADILVLPQKIEQIQQISKLCSENNWSLTILGEGSNVLIADEGLRGIVLLTTGLNTLEVDIKPNEVSYITVGAGVKLAKLADTACKAGLQGLEFAQAIPGSVGGAVYMNAGAYGHDIEEVCTRVTVLQNNKLVEIPTPEMGFGYRTSRIQREGGIIVEALFRLLPGDMTQIQAETKELNNKRREKQPFEPSAGSTFKRPEGHFAGGLIEQAGLKGFTVGGAQVSEKHAGFVINKGGATAEDVCRLMHEVRNRVHEMAGVWLEPEVKIFGRKYPWET
ncbi:MAG: UDP-N-acetylmuramate dehydrogenase [Defluviitaleaceae bacterium]|nr:UDP-N-acetylmuramate dehydrogenase [Defluviitaleaceae bacterium]MCL2273826.1 UDP-N-acetylmuramate dehydrogenase [Defluviitaleaceae bacterium]